MSERPKGRVSKLLASKDSGWSDLSEDLIALTWLYIHVRHAHASMFMPLLHVPKDVSKV